MKCTQNS